MNTADAAKGQWEKIFAYYGLPSITGRKHFKGKCPLCERKGKFRIDDKDGRGTWICTCGSGTGFQLLERTQGKSFKDLADEVDQLLGNAREKEAPKSANSSMRAEREKFISCYALMPDLKNTSAAGYLQSRGIFTLPAEHIRFCERQPTRKGMEVINFQAMWALATDSKGQLCYLHRTYLDGNSKADILVVKRQTKLQEDNYLDYADSVAIRMFPVASTLGVAEGIETALSCKQVYGVNTWATINAGFMDKFVAPQGVTHLVVFADTDTSSATGHAAAFACARRNLVANNDVEKVSVRWPDKGDFNDLIREGSEVRELVFYREKHREAA